MNKTAIKKRRKIKELEPDVRIESRKGALTISADTMNEVLFVSAVSFLKASDALGMSKENTLMYLAAAAEKMNGVDLSQEVQND